MDTTSIHYFVHMFALCLEIAFMFSNLIGLSKEGWYIIKNLFTELAVLLSGYFTFVPAVQV